MKIYSTNFKGIFVALACLRMIFAAPNENANAVMCLKTTLPLKSICQLKARRYDVSNFGKGDPYFHSWVDVQGLGYSNDYCRIVRSGKKIWLSCALAGTQGESDTNYDSSKSNFDLGLTQTWYMKDEDGDGRDDYCRCVENDDKSSYRITCTKAGIRGFSGSAEEGDQAVVCMKHDATTNICRPKARRYDISDVGHQRYFHGWVDVQAQGAANDFCRIVGEGRNTWLSCALAGTHGEMDTNYNSETTDFPLGISGTWYMRDEDGDGRDDYCRCLGDAQNGYNLSCTKAGCLGFHGSTEEGGNTLTFDLKNVAMCKNPPIRPEFREKH